MIVDCHTHLNRYTEADPPTLPERHQRLREVMDENGIGHAMVLTSYRVNDERPSARQVADAVADDPRIGVVAGVSVQRSGAAELAELRGLLQEGRVRGIKLYPGYEPFELDDRQLWGLYEMASEFRVPVMIHTGDTYDPRSRVRFAHPLAVDDVAVRHHDVTFVICHLGNPWFADAMEVIYKNPNVLGDFCGLTLGTFEERYERLALRRVNDVIAYVNDPHKLMFGTDWPISDLGSYLRFTEKLDLTENEREGVLWRNAARVFGIPVDGAEADGGRG